MNSERIIVIRKGSNMNDKQIIKRLTAELEEATKSKWIEFNPYSENSPENDKRYIAFFDGQVKELFFCDDNYWCEFYGGEHKNVTHWQPLPDAPEVSQ